MKIIFTILLIFISLNSYSLCGYNFTSSSIFETSTNLNIEVPSELGISRPNTTTAFTCGNVYYFFSKGRANSYSRKAYNSFNESINYNLYKNSGQDDVLKDSTDFSNSDDYVSAYLQYPNTIMNSKFYFYLPALTNNSMLRAGTYTDNITVNVFSSWTLSPYANFELSRSIPITIIVPKTINVSLVDSGQAIDVNSTNKNLDFGVLETGETKSFDLMIQSNAGYKISLSSLNNGRLNNLSKGVMLDYSLSVAGSAINLSNSGTSPVLVATGAGVTGNAGVRFPVSVQIGEVKDSQWGDYQDYITITAASND